MNGAPRERAKALIYVEENSSKKSYDDNGKIVGVKVTAIINHLRSTGPPLAIEL
jgi:hypothetical protein